MLPSTSLSDARASESTGFPGPKTECVIVRITKGDTTRVIHDEPAFVCNTIGHKQTSRPIQVVVLSTTV
jgi:hypothetical protein